MPDGSDRISPGLQQSFRCLTEHPEFSAYADVDCRGDQLTISAKIPGQAGQVRALAIDLLAAEIEHGIKVVHSTHSIDVLAPGASKLALIAYMERVAGRPLTLLRVGDLGRWPGNDFEHSSPFRRWRRQTTRKSTMSW
jgi:hypothetical protein